MQRQKKSIYIQYHAVNTFAFVDGKNNISICILLNMKLLRSQISWN